MDDWIKTNGPRDQRVNGRLLAETFPWFCVTVGVSGKLRIALGAVVVRQFRGAGDVVHSLARTGCYIFTV